jgi:uncharacterized protein YjiS (DUF1127 family)
MTTIKTITRRQPSGFAIATDAVRRVTRVMAATWTAAQNRRQVRRLADLDDHLLADIGLTRDDVVGASSVPIHEDPTRLLAATAGMRGEAGECIVLRPPRAPKRR